MSRMTAALASSSSLAMMGEMEEGGDLRRKSRTRGNMWSCRCQTFPISLVTMAMREGLPPSIWSVLTTPTVASLWVASVGME